MHPIRRFRGWSPKKKVATLGALSVMALAGAALAFLFMPHAPFTGGGSVATQPGVEFVDPASVLWTDGLTATAVLNSGEVNIVLTDDAVPGGSAGIAVHVRRLGDVELKVQDVRFSDVTNEYFLNSGGNPTGGKGQLIPATGFVQVDFVVEIPADAPAGGFTAQVDAGVFGIDAPSYNAADGAPNWF